MQHQLIEHISQRAGIPAEKVPAAADTVIGYLNEHLPGPVASQLDNAMSGDDSGGSGLAGAAGKIGGMFGNK
jgi:hypothetical protein